MLATLKRPATLKESALEKLREAITLGKLEPGERLVERVLCEQLGVSRTVVRECVRHLESERLVTTIANAGPSVAVLDAQEVRQIYDIRAMLERAAVRSCAKAGTAETVKQLRKDVILIKKALVAGDVIEALGVTRKFYATIFIAGNKSVSWDLVEQLNGRIGRLRALTLGSKGRSVSGPKNLKAIVEAIADGNTPAAVRACDKHLAEALAIALTRLSEVSSQAEHIK